MAGAHGWEGDGFRVLGHNPEGRGPGEQAQYTQLTGTHWGSVRSFSKAAWSSWKVLSRLLLTRLRSK